MFGTIASGEDVWFAASTIEPGIHRTPRNVGGRRTVSDHELVVGGARR